MYLQCTNLMFIAITGTYLWFVGTMWHWIPQIWLKHFFSFSFLTINNFTYAFNRLNLKGFYYYRALNCLIQSQDRSWQHAHGCSPHSTDLNICLWLPTHLFPAFILWTHADLLFWGFISYNPPSLVWCLTIISLWWLMLNEQWTQSRWNTERGPSG